MTKYVKILTFFISLSGLIISVCVLSMFRPIPFIQNILNDYIAAYPWLQNIFTVYAVFVCICFIILLIISVLSPNKSNILTLNKDKGQLMFFKKTIESAVRYSFADLEGINQSRIKVKLRKKPEDTRISIKLSINDTTMLANLTESVQNKASATLQDSLGITAKSITVSVTEYRPVNKEENENSEDDKTGSRIL